MGSATVPKPGPTVIYRPSHIATFADAKVFLAKFINL